MLKPIVNSEGYYKIVKSASVQSVVECRFPQSSDITEVVAVSPQVSTVACEVSSGRVNYSGKLVLTVAYSDETGKLCRMQKGAEFSHFADDDCFAPAQSGVCLLSCEKVSVRREGSSFLISAIVCAKIDVYARAERTYISGAEGAFLNSKKVNLSSTVCFQGESEVEDDFEADSVADVLIPYAKPVVTAAECGTGEIEVEGELFVSLFAMRRETPVCLEKVIPFKCSLVCDDASVGKKAVCHAEITDLNVNASVNEERGKCDINVSCALSMCGWFADGHTDEAAVDAFSDSNEIECVTEKETCARCVDIKVYSERVTSLASTKSKLTYDCKFYAATLPRAECMFNEQSGAVEGAVNTVLIYGQDGEIKSTEVTMPFAVTLNGVCEKGQKVFTDVAVSGVSVRLKAEGEAEAEATLKVCATVCEDESVEYLSAVEEGEEIKENDCALSVFIPCAGDGLWDVAKKLRKSPSDVAACNKELKFPLCGKERIIVYRAKKV